MNSIATAADLMNPAVRTAAIGQDLEDVDFSMRMHGIHHLPVLDDDQRLVGVVSQRDLAGALADPAQRRARVESVMSREVQSVATSTPADELILILIEKRIGCLPVVTDDGRLVGIVTETDFLQLALDHVREQAARFREHTGYHR